MSIFSRTRETRRPRWGATRALAPIPARHPGRAGEVSLETELRDCISVEPDRREVAEELRDLVRSLGQYAEVQQSDTGWGLSLRFTVRAAFWLGYERQRIRELLTESYPHLLEDELGVARRVWELHAGMGTQEPARPA